MAVSAGPKIELNQLELYLDAENQESSFSVKEENLVPSSALGQQTEASNVGTYTVTTDNSVANPFGDFDGVLKFEITSGIPNSGYWRRGVSYPLKAGNTYTFSFYVKNGTFTEIFNLNKFYFGIFFTTFSPSFQEFSTPLSTTIDVGNGWYRQILTFTPSYNQTYSAFFNYSYGSGYGLGSFYLYGFQLERGSMANDYLPTTGTAIDRYKNVTDLTRNGNDATCINGVDFDINEKAFIFDGIDDYIGLFPSQISDTASSKTISIFFNTNATSRKGLCGTRSFSGIDGWVLTVNRTSPGNITYYHTGGSVFEQAAGININNWYNITLTHDVATTTVKFYKNGLLFATNNAFVVTNNSSFNGIIGDEKDNGPTWPFSGKIGIVQIYNRALSQEEIKQNFNSLRGRYGI